MSMRKRMSPAAARRRPAALFLLVDVLAAALLVFGNYFFLYIAPMQGLGGASMSLSQVQNNIQQCAGANPAPQPAGKICGAFHGHGGLHRYQLFQPRPLRGGHAAHLWPQE